MANIKIEFSPKECLRVFEVLNNYKKALDSGLKKPKKNGFIDIIYVRQTMNIDYAKIETKELKKLCDVFERGARGF